MTKTIANRYMLVKHIGQGGMADVYVAIDTVLNREVAIKILRGELCNDPVALLRFQREAVASTTLIHPNIVEIYDVGEDDGKHFIVMEYVRGKTLKQLITQRGAIIKDEAVDIMKQLVGAILEAHKSGIIHRDVKPQNVLVKDDGSIKVVDFGIALAQDALQLTQADAVMGSVHYLAPELARGEGATFQSDIYSLGIVFYELLTGQVPFKADQAVQVALLHMRNDIPSCREINPSIPQSIDNIILKACCKNKKFRYSNCQEMLDDLNTCLNENKLNEAKFSFEEVEADLSTKVIKNADTKHVKKIKETKKTKKKDNFFYKSIIAIISVVSIIAILIILFLSGVIGNTTKMVKIPNIQFMTVQEANASLSDIGLILNTNNIERVLTDDVEKGLIIEVKPNVDTEVAVGSTVSIVVSSGIYSIISDYVGKNIEETTDELSKYPKLRVVSVAESNSEVTPGTIIRQELLEANSKFDSSKSNEIRLIYSAYSTIVIPHTIIGMDINQASDYLKQQGIEVLLSVLDTSNLTQEEISALDYGVVIECSPNAGTAYTQSTDSTVTLYYY